MNGHEVDPFEQHTIAGGLCTAWKRQGYTFDGCVSWLVGSHRKGHWGKLWRELGALEDRPIWDPDVFAYTEGRNGERFTMHADPDRLRAELKRVAPEDAKVIGEFCDAVKAFRTRGAGAHGRVRQRARRSFGDAPDHAALRELGFTDPPAVHQPFPEPVRRLEPPVAVGSARLRHGGAASDAGLVGRPLRRLPARRLPAAGPGDRTPGGRPGCPAPPGPAGREGVGRRWRASPPFTSSSACASTTASPGWSAPSPPR
ncbi:MAG: NAD(P)-binding protein [Chitinophagales bacterium]